MRRTYLAVTAVLAIAVIAVLGGAYAYYFSGLRSAPKPLSLPGHGAGQPASQGSPAGKLVGSWKIAGGSEARYRVREVFAGQASPHDAVGRTTAISGSLAVVEAAGALQATSITIVAGLAGLQSVDQVAGFNVVNRDRIVARSLDVQQYPDAVFHADSFSLPAGLEAGQAVTGSMPGRLTIHGVTRDVVAKLQCQLNAGTVEITGAIPTDMTLYNVTPPRVPITSVEPAVIVEFQLILQPA